MLAISYQFVQDAGDQGQGFAVVQTYSSRKSSLGEEPGLCDYELI